MKFTMEVPEELYKLNIEKYFRALMRVVVLRIKLEEGRIKKYSLTRLRLRFTKHYEKIISKAPPKMRTWVLNNNPIDVVIPK